MVTVGGPDDEDETVTGWVCEADGSVGTTSWRRRLGGEREERAT